MRFTHAIVVVGIILGFLFLLPKNILAATFTVTKTADTNDGTCDADCSLREAIVAANAAAGADTINFNIPTSDSGYQSSGDYFILTVSSTTLTLSDDSGVFINGYSQSGATRNTAPFGQTINTVLKIQVTSPSLIVLFTLTGDNNHIAGLNLKSDFTTSMFINTSSNNWLEGDFFGSDITGATATNWGSISIQSSSGSNVIGTNGDGNGDVGERNIFMSENSNNGGMTIDATSNNEVIAGNYFGTDKTGRVCSTGFFGRHHIFTGIGSSGHRIGTNYDGVSDSEESNIFGCVNVQSRAQLRIDGSSGFVQGNYIGTNPQGDDLQSFFAEPGIADNSGSTSWIIKGNVIAHNGSVGIAFGSGSNHNKITQNIIYDNGIRDGRLDIDLAPVGVNANDAGDIDTGSNNGMNFPVISTVNYVGGSQYHLVGTMDYNINEFPITVEIFKSNNESSEHGGATAYLGSTNVRNDGTWDTTVTIPGDQGTQRVYFTTTATNTLGDTSEFSLNYSVGGSDPQIQYSTCQEKAPTTVAILKEATAKSFNSILLTFTPPTGDFTHYMLEYGELPNKYYYGNVNIVSKPATSYLVTNLKLGKTYYFRVGVANGCATGGWSNEVSGSTYGSDEVNLISTSTPSPSAGSSSQTIDVENQKESNMETKVNSLKSFLLAGAGGALLLSVLVIFGKRMRKTDGG